MSDNGDDTVGQDESSQGTNDPSLYQSRRDQFSASFQVVAPAVSEQRNHGVRVAQPAGFIVPKNLIGMETLQSAQFDAAQARDTGDPIDDKFSSQQPETDNKMRATIDPESEGRLVREQELRRRALHVSEGRKDAYDYQE